MTGFVAAVLGDPAAHPTEVVGRLVGDWAMSGERPVPTTDEPREVAAEEPTVRWLTPADRWLDPLPGEFTTLASQEGVPPPWRTAADDESGLRHRPMPLPEGEQSVVTVVRADRPAADPAAPAITAPTETAGLRSLSADMTVSWPGVADVRTSGLQSVSYISLDEDIPNKAPTAISDTVTVSEDKTVVFDPTTNDTDPNAGDALWVKYVQDETEYGRTFWEEGGYVRYLPNPDFHGTDTISYTVTDGLAEATGTVSIAVTSVNDAPAAFHDAFTGVSGPFDVEGLLAPGDTTLQIPVLANDTDYDWAHNKLTVAEVSPSGLVTITADQKAVEWVVPNGGTASAEFQYRAQDEYGALSNWVTCKAWAYPTQPPSPLPVTAPDQIAVGDEVSAGDVKTNDSKETIAVLRTHPTGTRVSKFEFDGPVDLTPTLARTDEAFQYELFRSDGKNSVVGTVNLMSVDLTIHHGQGGSAVRELREHVVPAGQGGNNPLLPKDAPTGAFTVANLNDSNANNVVDGNSLERNLIANPLYPGSGEVDLMKLTLKKPPAVGGFKVNLEVTPAGAKTVRLWKSSVKADENPFFVADTTASSIDLAVDANFPTELWVETVWPSGAVGDVTIESNYLGANDTVSITSIWTKYEEASPHWPAGHFMANGEQALPAEADARKMQKIFVQQIGQLGKNERKLLTPGPPAFYATANAMLAKFQLLPGKLTPYTVMEIFSADVARDATFHRTVNNLPPVLEPGSAWKDLANDDLVRAGDDDGDMVYGNGRRSTDYVLSIDAPGAYRWGSKADGVYSWLGLKYDNLWHRHNFAEFVRIKVDWPFARITPGTTAQGSRSSVFYAWQSLLDAIAEGAGNLAVWRLVWHAPEGFTKDQTNRIVVGHMKDVFQVGEDDCVTCYKTFYIILLGHRLHFPRLH